MAWLTSQPIQPTIEIRCRQAQGETYSRMTFVAMVQEMQRANGRTQPRHRQVSEMGKTKTFKLLLVRNIAAASKATEPISPEPLQYPPYHVEHREGTSITNV